MDKEWADAINDVYDTDEAKAPEVEEEEDEEPGTPDTTNTPDGDDDVPAEPPADDADGDGDAEPDGGEKDTPDVDAEKPEQVVPEPLSKESVKEALRELNQEDKARGDELTGLKNEVLDTLYPEGIDRQLRDSDGDPITGIDDLTKLINPDTKEYFTDEEAGKWLLKNQQELNREIEKMEKFAEEVAETHLTLKDATARVKELYGEFLEANPEIADELVSMYDATLVKDPKGKIIIKAPVDLVKFYDASLRGHMAEKVKADAEAAAQAAAQAKAAADEAAKAEKAAQAERGDIPPKGNPGPTLTGDTRDWANAYKSYYES